MSAIQIGFLYRYLYISKITYVSVVRQYTYSHAFRSRLDCHR